MKEIAIVTVLGIVGAAALVAAIVVGTGKSEASECVKWGQEADAYPGFYLAQWQKDECDANGIIINAPVK